MTCFMVHKAVYKSVQTLLCRKIATNGSGDCLYRFDNFCKMFVIVIPILLLAFCGCGKNSQLKGKVTFTDGQPAPRGMVIFSTSTPPFQARGEIKPDGTYTVSSVGKNDGLPKGEYSVSVTGVVKFGTDAKAPTVSTGSMTPGSNTRVAMAAPVTLCDDKYSLPETSGLKCTVPAPGNRFDIKLEPHPKNYP